MTEALAQEIGRELTDDGTAIVLDLDPVLGIQVAARLNARGCAHVVLVLPRWSYAQAVLPVDGLLNCLIRESKRLAPGQTRGNAVFVLDAERGNSIHRPVHDRRADNRYRISAADLPNLASLRDAGIRRVIKIANA
jgi:hypothetical protein